MNASSASTLACVSPASTLALVWPSSSLAALLPLVLIALFTVGNFLVHKMALDLASW